MRLGYDVQVWARAAPVGPVVEKQAGQLDTLTPDDIYSGLSTVPDFRIKIGTIMRPELP